MERDEEVIEPPLKERTRWMALRLIVLVLDRHSIEELADGHRIHLEAQETTRLSLATRTGPRALTGASVPRFAEGG